MPVDYRAAAGFQANLFGSGEPSIESCKACHDHISGPKGVCECCRLKLEIKAIVEANKRLPELQLRLAGACRSILKSA